MTKLLFVVRYLNDQPLLCAPIKAANHILLSWFLYNFIKIEPPQKPMVWQYYLRSGCYTFRNINRFTSRFLSLPVAKCPPALKLYCTLSNNTRRIRKASLRAIAVIAFLPLPV